MSYRAERHESLRRGSVVTAISKEVPWDIFDRLFLPVLYCHAIAIIFSALLNVFEVQFAFSTFGVFILLSIATVTLTLFYHNLKVSAASVCNNSSAKENYDCEVL